jgi:formylglycine-generating enzyme
MIQGFVRAGVAVGVTGLLVACSSSSAGAPVVAGSDGGGGTPACQTGGPGQADCGSNKESCCASADVTGGTFYRTYRVADDGAPGDDGGVTGEADPATVSTFRLDKYLVTVGRYRQFVGAWNGGAGYTPPAGSGKHSHLNGGSGLAAAGAGYESGWVASDDSKIAPTDANLACDSSDSYPTWTATPGNNEKLPINCVNWWEAYAFCIWDGGFLPTQAEWEYAAAGGNQQREYPWGSTDPGAGTDYADYNCGYPAGSTKCAGTFANIAPVGTAALGAGLWGQLDLVGDMYEWALDWSAKSYPNPCADCAELTPPAVAVPLKVALGTGFNATLIDLPIWNRPNGGPASRSGYFGLRCARLP